MRDSLVPDPIATSIAALALSVSVITAWLTLFRRGTVCMTQPTVIYFGPDSGRPDRDTPPPKVFLRTLLFATSKRGRIIESMHIMLRRNETRQNFNVWVYGDDKLVRGSGLYVGEAGVSANHHFLTPKDDSAFAFAEGTYYLEVFAKSLGDPIPTKLSTLSLQISKHDAEALREPETGIYFDWGPDSGRYLQSIVKRPAAPYPDEFLKLLRMGKDGPI